MNQQAAPQFVAASGRMRRLPPSRSFAEATALVEAALEKLKKTEASLERHLDSLRDYMDAAHIRTAPAKVSVSQ